MPPIIELTSAGVVRENFTQIRDGIETDLRANLQKPQLDAHSAASLVGNLNNAFSFRLDQVCQLAEAVANSLDPAKADEVTFPARAALVGLMRKPATKGSATFTCTFTSACSAAVGAISAHPPANPDSVWQNKLALAVPGAGTYAIVFESQAYGAQEYFAPTVLEIAEGPPQLSLVQLATQANITSGTDLETMLRFRRRLERGRQIPAQSPVDAIASQLEQIPTVARAVVIESAGQIEVVISDGGLTSDAKIAQAIYNAKAPGTIAVGDILSTLPVSPAVSFTRSNTVPLYLWVDVQGAPSLQSIADAAMDVTDALEAGADVDAVAVLAEIRKVSGVSKVTRFRISRTNEAPSAGEIDTRDVLVDTRQQAVLTTPNVNLVTS
jgi:uncharacterized phage protein gp47/JayE